MGLFLRVRGCSFQRVFVGFKVWASGYRGSRVQGSAFRRVWALGSGLTLRLQLKKKG